MQYCDAFSADNAEILILVTDTPDKEAEEKLQKEADNVGLSRSRFICNLLLEWQKDKDKPCNDCENLNGEWCDEFNIACKAPQSEAETCAGYKKKE